MLYMVFFLKIKKKYVENLFKNLNVLFIKLNLYLIGWVCIIEWRVLELVFLIIIMVLFFVFLLEF